MSSKTTAREHTKTESSKTLETKEIVAIIDKIEQLSPEKQSQILQTVQTTLYSGPIPPPDAFADYDKVLPGAADRIMTMAENQSRHRQKMEQEVVFSQIRDNKRGHWFGFIVALICIIGGFILIYLGKEVQGMAAVISPCAILAGKFFYNRYNEIKKKREAKASD